VSLVAMKAFVTTGLLWTPSTWAKTRLYQWKCKCQMRSRKDVSKVVNRNLLSWNLDILDFHAFTLRNSPCHNQNNLSHSHSTARHLLRVTHLSHGLVLFYRWGSGKRISCSGTISASW
jgi:hypothetical protein